MTGSHTRRNDVRATARRLQTMLILLAVALGTILLASSTPAAHAGPGEGPGSENTLNPPPPPLNASENPVVFLPGQTTKVITLTAEPYHRPMQLVSGFAGAYIPAGTPVNEPLEVHEGTSNTWRLETFPEPDMKGPPLTIYTLRPAVPDLAEAIPQRPGMNPR
jgi:hypothetical protein